MLKDIRREFLLDAKNAPRIDQGYICFGTGFCPFSHFAILQGKCVGLVTNPWGAQKHEKPPWSCFQGVVRTADIALLRLQALKSPVVLRVRSASRGHREAG